MPSIRRPPDDHASDWDAIPFPTQSRASTASSAKNHKRREQRADAAQTTDDVLAAFATVSRRINDLARELKCLGYFDEDSDRPRAA